MMSLKKLLCSATIMLTAATASLSANAAFINQQVNVGGATIASIGVDVNNEALGQFIVDGGDLTSVDSFFNPDLFVLESFSFLGEAVDVVNDVFQFDIVQDLTDLTKGFDFLAFDIDSQVFGETVAVSFFFDRAFPTFSSFEVFDLEGNLLIAEFGDTTDFSVVPEPSVLSVFALGMMLLLTARRQRR